MLAAYADAFPDLDADALRTIVMTDERYVVRTEQLATAQAAHAPVWRSRYDGPYTGLEDDPDPSFAQYAPLLIAARTAATPSASGRAVPTCPPPCTPPGARSPPRATPAGHRTRRPGGRR